MIINEIKKDRLLAKKDGNIKKYETLTTLFSEVQRLEKIDQEDDVKVQNVIRKFLKGLEEMIDIKKTQCINNDFEVAQLQAEAGTVKVYLPAQLTEEFLSDTIDTMIKENGFDNPRDMGKIMKLLKEKFDGQFDGKVASTLARMKLVK